MIDWRHISIFLCLAAFVLGVMPPLAARAAEAKPKCGKMALPFPAGNDRGYTCIDRGNWGSTKGKGGCKGNQIPVPDERHDVNDMKYLCMSLKEWKKAERLCKDDPLGCTCQDADTVGHCGD